MARLFLALLIALALLPTPGAATLAATRDCTMVESGMALPPADHDEGCCTDECVMVPGAVALPSSGMGEDPPEPVAPLHWSTVMVALLSSSPAADDPPPRA